MRGEYAQHADQQQVKQDEVFLQPFFDLPGGDSGKRADNRRENDQRHGDAVHSQLIVQVKREHFPPLGKPDRDGNPLDAFDKLRLRRLVVEGGEQHQGQRQRQQRAQHPNLFDHTALMTRDERQDQDGQQRRKDDQTQQDTIDQRIHLPAPSG